MRILVTNDDGINAPGLKYLVSWTKEIGEVTVVAPKTEQSGKSQSLNLFKDLEIKKVDYSGAEEAWYVDSTPADCVRFAFDILGEYDVVMSGVNRGHNIGDDIPYSGTCGAMFESELWGAKGIAFSCSYETFDSFPKGIGKVWEFFEENKLLEKGDLWNVNFPDNPSGIRITRQGGPFVQDHFVKMDGDMWRQEGYYCYRKEYGEDNWDTNTIVETSLISITPMRSNRTNEVAYNALKGTSLKF